MEKILYREDAACVTITFNRPQVLNALDLDCWYQLGAAFERAAARGLPIVLTGQGRAFCSGDDINEFDRIAADPAYSRQFFLDAFYRTVVQIAQAPLPVIAAVNGLAYGAGTELLLLADLVIAAEDARFCLPEGRVGVFPALFSVLGPQQLPMTVVSDLIYNMRVLDAHAARAGHLVNQVVPGNQLDAAVAATLETLSHSAPRALRAARAFARGPGNRDALPRIYRSLEMLAVEFSQDPGFQQAIDAFRSR